MRSVSRLALRSGLWLFALMAVSSGDVLAAMPEPWKLGFQAPATPIMERVEEFHNYLLIIITLITLFVLGLLVFVIVRFNERANPVPSRTAHNTLVEILWTLIPVGILVAIAIPSFKLLYYEDTIPDADMTIKVTAQSWNWTYDYPDNGDISVISNIVSDDKLQPGQPRLLTADESLVIPAGKTIRVLVTSADILHAFAVPAFGVKIDAVPGRLNETWLKVDKPGTYYGQCSELCGRQHAFMPIQVKVVPQEAFDVWVANGGSDTPPAEVAAVQNTSAETNAGSMAPAPAQHSNAAASR